MFRHYRADKTKHCLQKTVFEPSNIPFSNCFDRPVLRLYYLFWRAIRKNIDLCQQFFGPLKRVLLEDLDSIFCISLTSLANTTISVYVFSHGSHGHVTCKF